MARIQTVTLISDLDQSVTADETVAFALDGRHLEIDLSAGQAGLLRELLSPYVAAGRRASNGNGHGKGAAKRARTTDAAGNAAVRTWAKANGYPGLADRGRIPGKILEAYAAAH